MQEFTVEYRECVTTERRLGLIHYLVMFAAACGTTACQAETRTPDSLSVESGVFEGPSELPELDAEASTAPPADPHPADPLAEDPPLTEEDNERPVFTHVPPDITIASLLPHEHVYLGPIDVARVTAMGHEVPNAPTNTLDGDASTRWSLEGVGSWISFELGRTQALAGIEIAWYRAEERSNAFTVEASSDGVSFLEVLNTESRPGVAWELYEVGSVAAKFVRVVVNGNTANEWASINEIAFRGIELGSPTVSDNVDPAPDLISNAPSDGFPLGTTDITWLASDRNGNRASVTQTVSVVTLQPPPDDPPPQESPPDDPPPDDFVDAFGLRKLYPSADADSRLAWDSTHWSDGQARTLSNRVRDPRDPEGWSEARGNGELEIDGQGILHMRGVGPRLYLEASGTSGWKNVEVTIYYQRLGSDGAAYAGLVVGVRSGYQGHASATEYCNATTYYAAFRHDGLANVVKELKHPACTARATQELWNGALLPSGQWIGMKFVVYNVPGTDQAKLEVYRDLSEGSDGGTWERVNEYVDDGDWTTDASGCSYPSNHIISQGGGVVLIRNTEIQEAQYKWVSAREIQPPGAP